MLILFKNYKTNLIQVGKDVIRYLNVSSFRIHILQENTWIVLTDMVILTVLLNIRPKIIFENIYLSIFLYLTISSFLLEVMQII